MVALAATNFSKRKSIVDTTGAFPQMLMELDPDATNAGKKSYVWANGQVLAQYDGDTTAQRYFYLHDRLGSVRNVLHYDPYDSVHPVKIDHAYTYNPYGETVLETSASGAVSNDFRFAGYTWDDVVDQYFCNARWYDPRLTRFTGRDPVMGKFQEPLTLHAYLYCLNDPMNWRDPSGKFLGFDPAFAQSIRSKLESAQTVVVQGIKRMVQGFTERMSLISELQQLALEGTKEIFASIHFWGRIVNVAGNAIRTVGIRGFSQLTKLVFISETFFPGGTLDFVGSLLGDPRPPTTPQGSLGSLTNSGLEKLSKLLYEEIAGE